MRIFLDANILFSAAKSDGAIRQLLTMLHDGDHVCCVDAYVVEEARRNILLKTDAAPSDLEGILRLCEVSAGAVQRDAADVNLAWLPEKDRPVLAAAIRLRCDALVTGDRRHFGAGYGKRFGGVLLCSPRMLAQVMGPG
jgi:hypothetical protein